MPGRGAPAVYPPPVSSLLPPSSPRRRRPSPLALALALAPAAAAIALGACIVTAPQGIHRQTDDDAGAGGGFALSDAAPPDNPEPDAAGGDPHAVIGAEPSHGPFAGGQR